MPGSRPWGLLAGPPCGGDVVGGVEGGCGGGEGPEVVEEGVCSVECGSPVVGAVAFAFVSECAGVGVAVMHGCVLSAFSGPVLGRCCRQRVTGLLEPAS